MSAAALWIASALVQATPVPPVEPLSVAAARASRDRALTFLVSTQHDDGSWARSSIEGLHDSHYSVESYYAWQVAAQQLAILALLETPAETARDAALHRAVDWLLSARLPRRGSHWDNDAVWSHLYGVVVCTKAPPSRTASFTKVAR